MASVEVAMLNKLVCAATIHIEMTQLKETQVTVHLD